QRPHLHRKKSIATRASSSPRSSCRKCPPPAIVTCGCPAAPWISCCRSLSAPRVTGSPSENAVSNGRANARSPFHAATLAALAGGGGPPRRGGRAPRARGARGRPGGVAWGGDGRAARGEARGRARLPPPPAADDPARREDGDLLRELPPRQEPVRRGLVPRRQ